MDPLLLSILQCPHCKSPDLFIQNDSCGDATVQKGHLRCDNCSKTIEIDRGIINCLSDKINSVVIREIDGNRKMVQRERANVDDEWLLSLPLSFGDVHKDLKGHDALSDLKYLVESMSIPPSGYVIDLGAGTCWASSYLFRWGYKPVAIDVCRDKYVGLDSAETYFSNFKMYFDRVLMEIESLALFRDNSVDGIIAISSIHHSRDILNTLKEARRVLKKECSFGIVEGCCSIFDIKQSILQKSEEVKEYGWNENIYRILEFKKLFSKAKLHLRVLPAQSTFIKMDNWNLKSSDRQDTKYRFFNLLKPFFWKKKNIRLFLKEKLFLKLYLFICIFISLEFIGISRKRGYGDEEN